jgi:hypothetical protein
MIQKSKAFAKLQRLLPTCTLWLTDLSRKAGFSVDTPFLKPYCCVTGMLLVCRLLMNLLCIAFWSTSVKTGNTETGP